MEGDLVRVHSEYYDTHTHGILLKYDKIQKIATVLVNGTAKRFRAANVTKAGRLDNLLISTNH